MGELRRQLERLQGEHGRQISELRRERDRALAREAQAKREREAGLMQESSHHQEDAESLAVIQGRLRASEVLSKRWTFTFPLLTHLFFRIKARLFELGSAHATLRAEASAADRRAKQAESEANAFQMQLSERDEQLAQRVQELEQARARISELENEASDQAEKLMRSARDREAELATGLFCSLCDKYFPSPRARNPRLAPKGVCGQS